MATRILPITILAVAAFAGTASAQTATQKITIGIYAPTVEFGTAQARLQYVQGLAKAVEQSTGIPTVADSYASFAALKKANVDYAIIDGPCYATNLGWNVLANATVGGGATRQWALFSSAGDTMQSLKGKKLAYVQLGCNDNGFIDNAMLESEVDPGFFGARVGEKDLTGAMASVTSYKSAQAVFAPVASVKGMSKVFETGAVPNPAFVEVNTKLPAGTSGKVAAAVVGYGAQGAISGWTKGSKDIYQSFAARLGPVKKSGIFANPDPVRIDAKEVLVDPTSIKEPALIAVRHHFVRPPGSRLDD